jgi:hypothetical protein
MNFKVIDAYGHTMIEFEPTTSIDVAIDILQANGYRRTVSHPGSISLYNARAPRGQEYATIVKVVAQ